MTELLLEHIRKYIPLEEEAGKQIAASFTTLNLQKRQIVVAEGELCTQIYFVEKGCLRMFYLDEKGVEQTIQFALENWWMTDIEAFNKKRKSAFSIQAVEKCVILGISKKELEQLLKKQFLLEKYFRIIYERAYSASLFRMKFFRMPKDEFYDFFCASYPEFLQRVPQKLLASFLGFTPEYLSELRKKKVTSKL